MCDESESCMYTEMNPGKILFWPEKHQIDISVHCLEREVILSFGFTGLKIIKINNFI